MYGLHYTLFRDENLSYGPWHRVSDQPYRGKFRTDRNTQVEYGTPTWNLLWETVTAALDTFHEQTFGWEGLSTYLRHAVRAETENDEIGRLRVEIGEREKRADGHRAERDRAGRTVPASVLGRIKV
jgi:hypothetical protein